MTGPFPETIVTSNGRIWVGVGCGIAAGALWGLVFLAPELVREFTPLQLATARYLAYGLFAIVLIAPRWRRVVRQLTPRDWWALVWLSLLGNIFYYVLLASAVQLGGIAMTSLIIGFLPVAVTLIGSRDHGATPLSRLAPSLLLGTAGILCIGWQSLHSIDAGLQPGGLIGLACAIAALASWTSFAIGNARWLVRVRHLSSHDWNLLTGVVTGGLALLLLPPAILIGAHSHDANEWLRFAAVAAGVALFASIIGNAFWNWMSRLMPLTLVGQMILFETLFALLYGFLWERRLPTTLEGVAIVLVVASVFACVTAHRVRDGKGEAVSQPGAAP
ncbi:multidrug DMT transporter permease [Kaistia sp. 32K]|uniref:DMT family transporter n=1 Tax=Kaistia sp. 32K TaxID=2795690 RepID=UPI00191656BE|nr:DMT family transporter [Kaistia sp. 32K]BCP54621.1 multidrug DMT transporter permease [Kaistia sp. 32K]